ncbi:MAG: GyrI-like domain-containing protein [Cellulomonas sp.]|uniref:AraC effector-binding domain-containing protein n=1 Tax=Cellulomonas gelida TaxID=1712 RepID=A0A4Y3KGR7_9CELL|nr:MULTISPECIES: GyrI-like domain-containing protein [Cellulomonas]KMM47172.1 transcriptional regulator [Cellulomonas sp. A375-1]MCR6646902.1 GyrI-like domain-containing protein [Cellulomonas sp.]MCR6706297.1 GyrI-like domain-containing protein [Cellulomonas sp.]GEA83182.1 hypothetical protein CGE01nite_04330 [Cellulomonas gelida]GGL29524.1 hypothetical protein GCM10009774_19850 [Cellulomonas gelida]
MEIEQVELTTTTAAVVRERVRMDELAAFYDRAYGQVAAALGAAGVEPQGPAIGWYAQMPAADVDVAAGFAVPSDAAVDGVELLTMSGGPAAIGTYQGPYDGLGDAWSILVAWCAERGLQGRGDFWEEYVTDPDPDGDPSQNVTRLVLPLL